MKLTLLLTMGRYALACLATAAACLPGCSSDEVTPATSEQGGAGGQGAGGQGAGGEGSVGGGINPPEAICGDGKIEADEECDDSNFSDGDGCSEACTVEPGWQCKFAPSQCEGFCGDGVTTFFEECDDQDFEAGDGCDHCQVEPGWSCDGASPTVCAPTCGDGVLLPGERCDDGNTADDDGCSATCEPEPGYWCPGSPSACRVVLWGVVGENCRTGNLLAINPETGGATSIGGPLEVPLTGISFDHEGVLYGVSSNCRGFAEDELSLYTIDTHTAELTRVGALRDEDDEPVLMPDLAFASGALWGNNVWDHDNVHFGFVDVETGLVTSLGSGNGGPGNAIAADAGGVLHFIQSDDDAIYVVDPDEGTVSEGPAIACDMDGRLAGMTFHEGLIHGVHKVDRAPATNRFVRIDPSDGECTVLGPMEQHIESVASALP